MFYEPVLVLNLFQKTVKCCSTRKEVIVQGVKVNSRVVVPEMEGIKMVVDKSIRDSSNKIVREVLRRLEIGNRIRFR